MALPLTDDLAAPAATLPAGVSLRPFEGDHDLAAFVEIFTAANEADGIDERTTLQGMRSWAGHPSRRFDASRDVVVAEDAGKPVAYGWTSWVDTTDGVRDYSTRGHVHPAWRRQGVGTAILRHNEAHLRELAAAHDVQTPRVYGAYAPERRPGAIALLEGNGYRPVRWFFDMVRPTLDDVVVPALPPGLELRPVSGREQLRQLFDADREAFRDHWGGADGSDELFEAWLADPDYDPALFVVAWDGDEIAGAVWNVILVAENEAFGRRRGLLDSVYVRRPWRGRGLASALVGRSLQLLRERGMTSATLGVDADNPNGALRLYMNAGFRVDVRSTGYRKPMEVMD
ncbi:MAG TPA: GNAT family N-acetyltransferase [Candidatus Limnocylindria bacterium]|jgi:mycothiol synthase